MGEGGFGKGGGFGDKGLRSHFGSRVETPTLDYQVLLPPWVRVASARAVALVTRARAKVREKARVRPRVRARALKRKSGCHTQSSGASSRMERSSPSKTSILTPCPSRSIRSSTCFLRQEHSRTR